MRGTLHALPLIALVLVAGCNRAALPMPSDAATGDLAAADAAAVDLAQPLFDLARWCPDVGASSSVSVAGTLVAYAGLGDVDMGNEGNCGPPPEGVGLSIATDPSFQTARVGLQLPLPLSLGQTTTLGAIDQKQATITVNVTAFTVRGAGPGLATMAGTLSTADGTLSGSFSAAYCPLLDLFCI